MQGPDNNVITHTDTVKNCIAKLELWHGCVCAGKHYNAVSYSEVIVTVDDETISCRMKSEHQ